MFRRRTWLSVVILIGGWLVCRVALGGNQEPASEPASEPAPPAPVVVATVDNHEIVLADVDRVVAEQTRGLTLSPEALAVARAEALRQLVGQILVLDYLQEKKLALSADELQLELERWQSKLQAVGRTWAEFLADEHLSETAWRRELFFRRSWQRYLESMLTDANLQKHFERHRRELDGTRLHVQHLLIAAEEADPAARLARAAAIRQEIVSGATTWAAAVAEHSQGKSAAEAGDLGWIERAAPMPEAFSRAAFALQPEEISPPVATRFGVHLIRCVAVEPGNQDWQAAQAETRRHATRYLFDWIVERQRGQVQIEYTGACPHWNEDGELVEK